MDVLDATIHADDIPDGEFSLWQSQIYYLRRLGFWRSQFAVRIGLQQTSDRLLSIEKYSIGGVHSVRGYREHLYLRDKGFNSSIEWRISFGQSATDNTRSSLQLSVFADHAAAMDNNESEYNTEKVSLSSVGLGLSWVPSKYFSAEVFFAKGREDIKDVNGASDSSLQAKGVHLAIDYNYVF
jgi:hemolysin activation/secretion protein